MATMNVSLPDPMKEWVEERVKTGQYGNASEYIRDLIREDQEDDEKRRVLIKLLEEGEADLRKGRYIELDSPEEVHEFFSDLEALISDEEIGTVSSRKP